MDVQRWISQTLHRAGRLRLRLILSLANESFPQGDAVDAMGLRFASPVGMAAGLDRYGRMAHLARRVGLGFVETGTVMPRPESGGNCGIGVLLRNLERNGWLDAHSRADRARLGISIARNSSTPASVAWRDLVECMQRGWRFADYFVLNLGTLLPELMKDRALMWPLLAQVRAGRRVLEQQYGRAVPVLVKLQLQADAWEETQQLVQMVTDSGCDGIVAFSTDRAADQAQSGNLLKKLAVIAGGQLVLISVGGIRSHDEARKRLGAGASLIQLHRALLTWQPRRITCAGNHAANMLAAESD